MQELLNHVPISEAAIIHYDPKGFGRCDTTSYRLGGPKMTSDNIKNHPEYEKLEADSQDILTRDHEALQTKGVLDEDDQYGYLVRKDAPESLRTHQFRRKTIVTKERLVWKMTMVIREIWMRIFFVESNAESEVLEDLVEGQVIIVRDDDDDSGRKGLCFCVRLVLPNQPCEARYRGAEQRCFLLFVPTRFYDAQQVKEQDGWTSSKLDAHLKSKEHSRRERLCRQFKIDKAAGGKVKCPACNGEEINESEGEADHEAGGGEDGDDLLLEQEAQKLGSFQFTGIVVPSYEDLFAVESPRQPDNSEFGRADGEPSLNCAPPSTMAESREPDTSDSGRAESDPSLSRAHLTTIADPTARTAVTLVGTIMKRAPSDHSSPPLQNCVTQTSAILVGSVAQERTSRSQQRTTVHTNNMDIARLVQQNDNGTTFR
ncbi:hypothetical protein EK21DRAFT_87524 [Setomelanomma holmii]|uniref:Uncharacterized protein n=1 Tax=Setomelanomma holmii TaxID=210430 RepID=A0A9P4LNL9_9PLEO|nr:hypothetical protein EK21DRAFT_87524 [Setomelanomma holmii]